MEKGFVMEIVKDLYHVLPVGGKVAIGAVLLIGIAGKAIMDHGYELNISFKPAVN